MSRLKRLYSGETNIDFIGRRRIWFVLSGIVLLICIVFLATRQLNFGIEFQGGLQIRAPIPDDGPLGEADDLEVIAEVRDALGEAGASEAQIQVATSDDERSVLVQTERVTGAAANRVTNAVEESVGAEVADLNEIGEEWGGEITEKAIRALVIFIIVVIIFMSLRFEWKMGVATIIAMVHDMIITAGIYSIVGFEVTPSTIIALLTILGYSLYDTVVVFDKVEEDTQLYAASGRMTYQDAANMAMNEVFMRSLNTSLSTLLPVAALLFVGAGLLGADTLKDLALALFVGILTGAYSSIFVATPILSIWKEREPKYRNVRERVQRDALKAARKPAPALATAGAGEAPEAAAPAKGSATGARPTTVPPRAGSKKAKRRKRR